MLNEEIIPCLKGNSFILICVYIFNLHMKTAAQELKKTWYIDKQIGFTGVENCYIEEN